MKDNKIFIDIETIPSEEMPKLEDIKVPSNYSKPETILKYQQENQLEIYKKQALDSMQGRIICIGVGEFGVDNKDINIVTTAVENERILLSTLAETILDIRDATKENPHFVGWNISTFDLPWLWRKAIQYNLPSLRKLIPKDDRSRYTDLMKVWASDYKDYCSQANVARFLGISEAEGTGKEVFDWWKAGEINKIEAHCESDIRVCMEIYNRIFE
jgi:predicted PolB exonuclease-like 3'-5' exonuclease